MKNSFTLAEALIALAVLGVISVLTVPTLQVKVKEKQDIALLQTAYEQINSSYKIALANYGPPNKWNLQASKVLEYDENGVPKKTEGPSAELATKIILSALKAEPINKTVKYKYLTGPTERSTTYRYRLPNGIHVAGAWISNARCNQTVGTFKNYCGDLTIDLNGTGAPNVYGKDMFNFIILKTKILPQGIKDGGSRQIEQYCNMKSTVPAYNGYGCTAWVLYKENMDYLKKEIKW